MEKVYVLLFVLFVLSQISERIANFLKLKLSDTWLLIPDGKKRSFRRFFSFKNTKIKSTDPQKEKDREYRILKINIFTGVIISFCFRTDFFCIVRNISNPTEHIGWQSIGNDFNLFKNTFSYSHLGASIFIISTFFGCTITGIFISFGSKFWHDTLDLVLQIKNYKSMLTQKGLDQIQNNFSTLEVNQQEEIMDAAINENYNSWKTIYPNIVGCSTGLKKTADQPLPINSIVFKVNSKIGDPLLQQSEKIPDEILYKGYRIPTDVVEYGIPISLITYPGANEIPSSIGTNVSLSAFLNYGTVSLKVKKENEDYLLSCFHVLCTNRLRELNDISQGVELHNQVNGPPFNIIIPSANYLSDHPGAESLGGYFTDGKLTNEVDAAIARITNGSLINQTFFYDGQSMMVTGELLYDNMLNGMKLETFGCVSGHQVGVILDKKVQKTDVKIEGPSYRFIFTFNKLVELNIPCRPGDSGAPVLTASGKVAGIVVAGNLQTTFMIPFQFIKNALSISI